MTSLNQKPSSDKGESENPEQRILIGNRTKGAAFLTFSIYRGQRTISIRFHFEGKDGDFYPTSRGINLRPDEIPILIAALMKTQAESVNLPDKTQKKMSLQDRALCLIAQGFGPLDITARIFDGVSRRTTEAGKALRRCGLLEAGSWRLTPSGLDRAEHLQGSEGEASEGIPGPLGEEAQAGGEV